MRFLFICLAVFAPMPAVALSCLAPSVENSFARYDAADDNYVVVHGRLTLDNSLIPNGMNGEQSPPKITKVPAELIGSSLSSSGFVVPFDQPLTLELFCIGPWCGNAQNGEEVLAFVRKDADGYSLAISPCGGAAFPAPKPAMLRRVTQCLVNNDCPAD